MNAASKDELGLSLNDRLLPGPSLHADMVQLLLRFRLPKIAITTDISKMFLRIRMQPQDCNYLCFLWRRGDTSKPPMSFRMTRLPFGLTSSPFQAIFTVQQQAQSVQALHPEASQRVLQDTYVDDIATGANTISKATSIASGIYNLLQMADMRTHKWLSNVPQTLEKIPLHLRASEYKTKILGIHWNLITDMISLHPPKLPKNNVDKHDTMRQALSSIAQVFDPLGLLAPWVLQGKLIIQELWILQTKWDQPLPPPLQLKFNRWKEERQHIASITQPRCIIPSNSKTWFIAIFGDASREAYATAAYLVSHTSDGSKTSSLIFSKTRVKPLVFEDKTATEHSIPRLELLAALITARTAKLMKETLKTDKISCFTDSQITLSQIHKGPAHYKQWVGHRIKEILTHTADTQWFFVPTHENPSDIASQGVDLQSLLHKDLWWKGPKFLYDDSQNWTSQPNPLKLNNDAETKKMCCLTTRTLSDALTTIFRRFETWTAIMRLSIWCFRAIHLLTRSNQFWPHQLALTSQSQNGNGLKNSGFVKPKKIPSQSTMNLKRTAQCIISHI